jgi:hypothetical protein
MGLDKVREAPVQGLTLEEGDQQWPGDGHPGRVFVLCGVYAVLAESPVLNHEVNVAPRVREGAGLSDVAPDLVPGLDVEGRAAAHFR